MASPQNSLKLKQTNPYPTQNQNLDWVFRGAQIINGFLLNDPERLKEEAAAEAKAAEAARKNLPTKNPQSHPNLNESLLNDPDGWFLHIVLKF